MALYKRVQRGHGGDLIWTEQCEVCGTTNHVLKHHEDYSKELEIRYLCHKHHAQRHIEKGDPLGRPKGSKNKNRNLA